MEELMKRLDRKRYLNSLFDKKAKLFLFLFVLIFAISQIFIYRNIISQVYKYIDKINNSYLAHVDNVVDHEMTTIYSLAYSMKKDERLSYSYESLSIKDKQKLSKDFFKYYFIPDYIESIYIYYMNEERIISSRNENATGFIYSDLTWVDEYKKQKSESNRYVYTLYNREINGKNQYLTYIFEINDKYGKIPVVLAFNIDKKKLFDAMDAEIGNGRLIVDYNGEVIYDNEQNVKKVFSMQEYQKELLSKNMHINSVVGNNSWRYTLINNKFNIMADTYYIILSIMLFFLAALLTFLIWFIFTRRKGKQMQTTINKIGEYTKEYMKPGELNDVVSAVGYMHNEFINLKIKSVEGKKREMLIDLCSGDFDFEKIKSDMIKFGFKTVMCKYSIIIVCGRHGNKYNRTLKNIKLFKTIIENALDSIKDKYSNYLCVSFGMDKIVILCEISTDDKIDEIVHKIYDINSDSININKIVTAGETVDDIKDIALCYTEAVEKMEAKLNVAGFDVFLENIAALLDNKEIDEVIHMLEDQIQSSDIDTKCTDSQMEYLSKIIEIAYKQKMVNKRFDKEEFISEYHDFSRKQLIERLLTVLTAFFMDEQTEKEANSVIQIAMEYIENHYSDDLALTDVAEKVCLSPSYFATKFKSYTGIGFLEYLKNIRIEEAKKLLINTDLAIMEIATRVGYSGRNFQKTFKRETNMTPSEYRNKFRGGIM